MDLADAAGEAELRQGVDEGVREVPGGAEVFQVPGLEPETLEEVDDPLDAAGQDEVARVSGSSRKKRLKVASSSMPRAWYA